MTGPPPAFVEQLRNARTNEREAIFAHKLAYDLKVAAAADGWQLKVYRTEVDDGGYDLTADWGYGQRKFQVKTRMLPGGADEWRVAARLLKPTLEQDYARSIYEWQIYHPFGLNGGVILVEIDWKSVIPSIRYLYTDLYVLTLLRDAVIVPKPKKSARNALLKVAASQFKSMQKIAVGSSCFVRTKNVGSLLEIAGLPMQSAMPWHELFFELYDRSRKSRVPKEVCKNTLRDRFNNLTVPGKKQHKWCQ